MRESAVADIYLSDRRVTVGGQLYLPRLIGIGEQGSDVLISQDIKGTSDNVRFTFGNGDRVMQLANDTDLKYAEIHSAFATRNLVQAGTWNYATRFRRSPRNGPATACRLYSKDRGIVIETNQ